MSLKPCGECQTEISSEAEVCPKCGIKDPHITKAQRTLNKTANGFFGIGLILTMIGVFVYGC